MRVLPFIIRTADIVTTGSEVASGRIKDSFGPILRQKLQEYGVSVNSQKILPDDPGQITDQIMDLANKGSEMILVSGGMSVDPDDRTPKAIKDTGARIVSYGAPVLPGAMFLLAYLDIDGRTVPVVGLPGCVMYAKRTVFDLVLPRILAKEELSAEELARYGEGGMCRNCETCHFPNCGFGK